VSHQRPAESITFLRVIRKSFTEMVTIKERLSNGEGVCPENLSGLESVVQTENGNCRALSEIGMGLLPEESRQIAV
jgi:hypothetical protein